MDEDSWLSLLLIFVLLLLGAYFAASEIALSSVNKIRIKLLADRGDRSAKKVQYILDHFDRALSTLLIGNNLSHILASAITTLMVTRLWGTDAVAAATLVLTVIVFFFAELLPKSIAKKYSEHFSRTIAGSMILLMRLCTPVSFLLSKLGNAAAKLGGVDAESTVTEDELYDMIENITEEGAIEAEKGELVQSALSFGHRTAGDILTFRVDVDAVSDGMPVDELIDYIRQIRHSRLPVYHESIDNVVGILSCRKAVKAYLRQGAAMDIRQVMDQPFFVHSSTEVDTLLPEMNRLKINMAIVTDDYGGMQGVVTMEDILEELVGDIWDEDDEVVESFVQVGPDTFEVDASMSAEDCFDRMGYEDYDEDEIEHKNMGSLAYAAFEQIPAEGDSFDYRRLHITISKMKKQRIVTMRVTRKGGEAA